MLPRLVANPAVRFFAIFILIVEAAAFAGFSMNASRQSVNESVRQVIPRDLTSEWINGPRAVAYAEPDPTFMPVSALILVAAGVAGFHAIRGKPRGASGSETHQP